MEAGYPDIHLYFTIFNCNSDTLSLHFGHFLPNAVPKVRWAHTLHEAVSRIKEEWKSWQKHKYLQLEDEDVLNQPEVDAEEVAPELSKRFDQKNNKEKLHRIEV